MRWRYRIMVLTGVVLTGVLGLAACGGEPGSGAAYMSPPFGEYTTPFGPTDLAPDARVSRSADPFLRTPTLPPR